MATFTPNHTSILDSPHGHVGPVIFYSWKGIDCVRSMPQHYHDARTPQQLQNRSKLSVLMAFQSPLKSAIRNGYHYTTHHTSELNEATRINYHTALTSQGSSALIDYSNTYLSWGNLPRLANLQYLLLDNELLIHWDLQTSFNPNDKICIALYNENRHTAHFLPHCATRQDQGTSIRIPLSWQHDQLHVWLWLNGNTQNSTSQYLGTLNPLPHPQNPIQTPNSAQTQTPTSSQAQGSNPAQAQIPTSKNSYLKTPDFLGPKCCQTPLSLGSGSCQKVLTQILNTPPKIPDGLSPRLL